MGTANLILGDCIERMRDLPANSIDAVITDPPYFMGSIVKRFGSPDAAEAQYGTDGSFQRLGRGFMGKTWDGFTDLYEFQAWNKKWATEALRVLKPGGFMFAMGGTRTHHRLTCGIEDAGFMIRDELCWVYMQGFPKAQDLGMLIEKKLGGEGEIIGKKEGVGSKTGETYSKNGGFKEGEIENKLPTLPLAKEWQGWKTPALKPAFEPIVVAQKPCEGSITENVMKHGVGGYDIDECRIAYEPQESPQELIGGRNKHGRGEGYGFEPQGENAFANEKGRYPSNLLMQEECFGRLSKFFLIPKASKGEKEENLEDFEVNEIYRKSTAAFGNSNPTCKKYKGEKFPRKLEDKDTTCRCEHPDWNEPKNIPSANIHPTVKPVALMQHLIKLTTKPKYTVLDPFLGSGTTAVAALQLNRNVIGIEISEEYMKIAKARIAEEAKQTRLL